MVSAEAERTGTGLIVGASGGLGGAMAAEFFDRGWTVIGTARSTTRSPLHELADRSGGRVSVEQLDINEPAQLVALHDRLAHRRLDMLFVTAGTTNNEKTPIGAVPTADFVDVMTTNALGPMRVIETFHDLVPATGLIGAMSSGQGSITNNSAGGREVYRGSKAALNMFLRSFSARESETRRSLVLMAPGWIRTDLGGPDAPFSIEDTVPQIVDVLLSKQGRPGLEYLDRFGQTVPW